MKRLLVPKGKLAGELVIEGDALHYLARVLRVSPGEPLELFDGAGGLCEATVVSVGAERAVLRLGESRPAPPAPKVTLAQGMPKGDKLELVIQKATELGAGRIVPLRLARSVVRLDGERAAARLVRWRKIAEEAARQSGRGDVPEVLPPQELGELLAGARARGEDVAVLHEGERTARLGPWLAARLGRPVAIVVGPEGGLAPDELELARNAGAQVVGLGPRVLRTETAGLAALAVALHVAGELG